MSLSRARVYSLTAGFILLPYTRKHQWLPRITSNLLHSAVWKMFVATFSEHHYNETEALELQWVLQLYMNICSFWPAFLPVLQEQQSDKL